MAKKINGFLVICYIDAMLGAWHFFGGPIAKRFEPPAERPQDIPYTALKRLAQNHQISQITITDRNVIAIAKDNKGSLKATYQTVLPENTDVDKMFGNTGAEVTNTPPNFLGKIEDPMTFISGVLALAYIIMGGSLTKATNYILRKKITFCR